MGGGVGLHATEGGTRLRQDRTWGDGPHGLTPFAPLRIMADAQTRRAFAA